MKLQRWEPDFDVRFSEADYDEGNQYWYKAEDVAKLEESTAKLLDAVKRVMEWNGIYDTAVAHANVLGKHALVDYFIEVGDIIRSAISDAEQSQ